MKKLSNILVVSDMDNTLLTESIGIPQENLDEIETFCSAGGRFTVATGRCVASVRKKLSVMKLSAPAVLMNGGLIYDFAKEQVVDCHCMERAAALSMTKQLMTLFPSVGFEVMTDQLETYILRTSPKTTEHLNTEGFQGILADCEKLPGQWIKVVMAGSVPEVDRLQQYVQDNVEQSFSFARSQKCYYEFMAPGVSKAIALKTLCKKLDISMEDTYAVGDYYNDIEMMKTAGFSAAVGNAPHQVKRMADVVTGKCNEGGVAQFLETILSFTGAR